MTRCDEKREFLKKGYLDYFQQVIVEKVGGRRRMHHWAACMELVREKKLRKTKDGFCSIRTTDEKIDRFFKQHPWVKR